MEPRVPSSQAGHRRLTMSSTSAQRVVLASRPSGQPTERSFRIEQVAVPQPGPQELLLRTQYLSLNPHTRSRWSRRSIRARPPDTAWAFGHERRARIIQSEAPAFNTEGDPVVSLEVPPLSASSSSDRSLNSGHGQSARRTQEIGREYCRCSRCGGKCAIRCRLTDPLRPEDRQRDCTHWNRSLAADSDFILLLPPRRTGAQGEPLCNLL